MADGKTAVRRITFAPPAVENGGIQDPVHGGFHAGGAAGFDAAAGGIEPDIDALHEVAGNAHVVVFEEEEPAFDAGAFGEFHHLADEVLAVLVCRVGFAGIDELDRALGMVDEGFQPVRVAQQQGGALVAGGAAGEADGEDFRVENAAGVGQLGAGGIALGELFFHGLAGGTDQAAAAEFVGPPDFLVRNSVDQGSHFGLAHAFFPIHADVLLEQRQYFRRQPRGGMHAIGDVADWQFIAHLLGPDVLPHAAGDVAVQLADSIGKMGETQAEDGHRKGRGGIARRPAVVDEIPRINAGGGLEGFEVGFHQVHREGFIPGRDRRVGGEDRGPAGHFVGGLEVETLDFSQELQPGEAEEGGMTLVEVADIGFQPHCDEGAEATDGEEEFLADPVFMSPAVEPGGDFEEFRRVFGDIGVQQNQGDAADLEIPDAGMQFAFGEHDADLHQFTIGFPRPLHGEILDF